jgi:hypothetical protein
VRAPKERAPHRKMRRLVTLRLPAFRLLSSFVKEGKSKWRVVDGEAGLQRSRLALDKTPTRIAL